MVLATERSFSRCSRSFSMNTLRDVTRFESRVVNSTTRTRSTKNTADAIVTMRLAPPCTSDSGIAAT